MKVIFLAKFLVFNLIKVRIDADTDVLNFVDANADAINIFCC